MINKSGRNDYKATQEFYDTVYYGNLSGTVQTSRHLNRLATKIGIRKGHKVLDVACGKGSWLHAAQKRGADITGVDLSSKAINICKANFSAGEFFSCAAEKLPFENQKFDFVSCLGALEHFLDPLNALQEMVRVAKDSAVFVILVPNADFLTRRLGLYMGTQQVDIREEVKTLKEWQNLFESAGLIVEDRWKDLHILSWSWIVRGKWYLIPLRAVQAFALSVWPLTWQYQVYHLCKKIE